MLRASCFLCLCLRWWRAAAEGRRSLSCLLLRPPLGDGDALAPAEDGDWDFSAKGCFMIILTQNHIPECIMVNVLFFPKLIFLLGWLLEKDNSDSDRSVDSPPASTQPFSSPKFAEARRSRTSFIAGVRSVGERFFHFLKRTGGH